VCVLPTFILSQALRVKTNLRSLRGPLVHCRDETNNPLTHGSYLVLIKVWVGQNVAFFGVLSHEEILHGLFGV